MTELRLALRITQDGAGQVQAALDGVSTAEARVGQAGAGAAPGQKVLATTLDAVGATATTATTQLDGLANAEGRVGQAGPANATRLGEFDRALAGTGGAAAATSARVLAFSIEGQGALQSLAAQAQATSRTLSAALGMSGVRNLSQEHAASQAAAAMQAQAAQSLAAHQAAQAAAVAQAERATAQAMLDEARAAGALSAAQTRAAQGARMLVVGEAELRAILAAIETPQERHAAHLARTNALFEAGALTAAQYHRALAAGDAQLMAATRNAQGLTGGLGAAAKGMAAFAAAERLLNLGKTAAQMQDLETRIKGVTATTGDYAGAETYLISLAEKHHKTISSLSGGYVQLLALEETGVLTRREVQQATAGLSNEQSRLGASSEQLHQVMYGLGQALSAPIVQFDELHQVTDPLPGLMGRMERALGLATGSFKDLAEGAGLSRDLIKKGFLLAITESEGAAERAGNNISSSFQDIKREWELLGKAAEKPVQFVVDAVETPGAMIIKGYRLLIEEIGKANEPGLAKARQAASDRALLETSGWDSHLAVQGKSLDQLQAMHDALVRLRGQYGLSADQLRVYGQQLVEVNAAMEKAQASSAAGASKQTAAIAKTVVGVQAMIEAASKATGVSTALIRAVGTAESTMQQSDSAGKITTSPKGALGTMQLMPATARAYGVDPAKQDENILGGARYLADLIKKYTARYHDAEKALTATLAAYNMGEPKFDKRGLSNLPDETEKYVARIKKLLVGSDLAGKVLDLGEYKKNLDEATKLFSASLDQQTAQAEAAGKSQAAVLSTREAELEAWRQTRDATRTQALVGKTGQERREQERANLAAELADREEYARRKAVLDEKEVALQEQSVQARLKAYRTEAAQADEYEVSAAERLKIEDKIKAAQTDLVVLAERRRQIEIRASGDIAEARAKEAEAVDKARRAAVEDKQAAIQRVQDITSQRAQNLTAQVSAGLLTEGQARKALVALYDESAHAIAGNVAELERLAAASNDPALVLAAERAKGAWLEMAAGVKTPLQALAQQWRDTTSQMEQATVGWANGFADALADVMVTGRANWRGLLDTIESDLARMAAQRATAALIDWAGLGNSNKSTAGGVDFSSLWATVKGWFGGTTSSAATAQQAGFDAAMAAGRAQQNGGVDPLTGYSPNAIPGSTGSFKTKTGNTIAALAAPIAGALAQAITLKTNLAFEGQISPGVLKLQSIVSEIADAVGNLGGWFALAKFVRPVISWQNRVFQSIGAGDRKLTGGNFALNAIGGTPLGPIAAAWLAPIVKSGAGYWWDDNKGLVNKASYTQNGAPLDALLTGGRALSEGLFKAQDILGVDLGKFGVEMRNRGGRFWLRGYDEKGNVFSDIGGDKGIRLTDVNMAGQLGLLETAILKRQAVLKQFDDYMVRAAIKAGENLSEIGSNLTRVQRLREFEGEATALGPQLTQDRAQYGARARLVMDYLGGQREKDELAKLTKAYQRQFEGYAVALNDSIASLTGGPSGMASALRTLDDSIAAIRAQNKELAHQAKVSKGTLTYTPLTEADIQAIGAAGFRKMLRDLSGESQTFGSQLADLTAKFDDMRRDAARYGVTLAEVAASEAKARKNLIDSYTSGLRATMEASSQALIDSVRGPQATLARLNTEIDTGMAGLNALSGAAAQESMDKIMGLLERRYQIEIGNLQALISGAQSLKQTISGLALSDASPLSPMEKLAKSQNDFWQNLAGAQKGDATAMGNLGGSLSTYIGFAKDYYTPNSPEFRALYDRATGAAGLVAENALSDVERKAREIQERTANVLEKLDAYLERQASKEAAIAEGLNAVAKAVGDGLGDNGAIAKAVKANNKATKK